jgi:hypothetical protein
LVQVSLKYGKDNEENGSFKLLFEKDNLNNDYLIRLSTQYRWIIENNNWFIINVDENLVKIVEAVFLVEKSSE